MGLGIFICIGVWIFYGLCKAVQDGKDNQLTKDGKQWSQSRGDSTYHDYKNNCTRSTKTGEKCIKLYGLDVDGKQYSYVATKPAFGPQKIYDIKYTDPRNGTKVKVDPETMARWKRNGQI